MPWIGSASAGGGLALLFACGAAWSMVAAADTEALINVTVVDVAGARLVADQTVVWQRSRIVAVGPAAEVIPPADASVHDGSGRFVIPGLWDMHVHLWPQCAPETLALPLLIAHGVTAVRDMSDRLTPTDPTASDAPLKRQWDAEARAGARVGPRIVATASFPINGPSLVRGRVPAFLGATTQDDARRLVQFVRDERAYDFIKVYSNIAREPYFALLDEARRRGIEVSGHKPLAVSFVEAADAGQRSIEHAREILLDSFPGAAELQRNPAGRNLPPARLREVLDTHDPKMLAAIVDALVRNGTYYCPTHVTRKFDAFATDETYVSDPRLRSVHPLMREAWEEDVSGTQAKAPTGTERQTYRDFLQAGLAITAQLDRAGVHVLAGTDAGDSYCFYGSGLHDELELMVSGGMTPAAVLRAATITPALYAGRSDDFGAVAAGRISDLVILRANPLEQIGNVRAIDAVVFNGRFFNREELDALLVSAEKAAAENSPK